MRVPVLPRAVAASVTVSAVAKGGRAIAATTIIVTIPGLIDLFMREGYARDLTVPLIALAVMLGTTALTAFWPSPLTLVVYIVVGAACVYFYLLAILGKHPELLPAALILINRPATALVLVGGAGAKPLPAVAWGIGGFAAGAGATALACLQLGLPPAIGNGPAITLANYCAAYLALSLIQRAQRGRIPDFLLLRQETRRLEAERTMEQRAVALLHDTVLNDLALVINAPDILDDRTRERMLRDVATLAETDLLTETDRDDFVDAGDASLRNQMMAVVSDFQWRGLNVEITGDSGGVTRIGVDAVSAAVGAVRASLENVLAHSGVDSAEVIISATDTSVTWTVSDAGRGFDQKTVPPDRLGLRSSVFQRVESAEGAVKVWSTPGRGTAVLITLPLLDRAAIDGRTADA